MREPDAPRLLLVFLAAASIVVLGIVLAVLLDTFWAIGAAAVLLLALLAAVLREVGHELSEEE